MALRRPPTTFSDSIDASDLAANSVTASELADNAVDADAIAANAVTTAKIADSSSTTTGITPAKIAENAVTSAKIATGAVIADGIGAGAVVAAGLGTGAVTTVKIAADVLEVKPHIKHGWLYPAMKDTGGVLRQTDGVTQVVASTVGPAGSAIASSLYGTVQSDGKMYYYTDIKGSKPIKDPRIGAYFGGQRHMFSSAQKLEQETATHGQNVYSVDGRDWCRFVTTGTNNYEISNASHGVYFYAGGDTDPDFTSYFEFTGYFNAVNWNTINTSDAQVNLSIDGVITSNFTGGVGAQGSPLLSRYVSAGSVVSLVFSSTPTLGIHTVRIGTDAASKSLRAYGIELIAQDTTSDTTKSQIQIQPQNVVSYGKRFAIDDTALHYNPFAFKTDGTTAWASGAHNGTSWPVGTGSSHNIDTATSLGLAGWLHSSNYYKPYNGGRVVVWVDSAGAIKTSVNVMPPNARSINTGAIAAKADASTANNTYLPTFEAGSATAYESSALAEVTKTFHPREFGNGGANHNATYKDYSSQANTTQGLNTAYVMDDGLTSLYGSAYFSTGTRELNWGAGNDFIYLTFIGTGFSKNNSGSNVTFAQNLPYGTHVIKVNMNASATWYSTITVDGVSLGTTLTANHYGFRDINYHQPKMPPIPENAVVIADYMLMADHVVQTSSTAGHISKGVRFCSGSRDHFYDAASAFGANASKELGHQTLGGYAGMSSPGGAVAQAKLPFFGTNFQAHVQVAQTAGFALTIGTTGKTETILQSASGDQADIITLADSQKVVLGATLAHTTVAAAQYQYMGCCVATPIHTSSHYQTFETPYLHELVGGDRNMEQTNLVVTGDGKTWDQVTRDVSYISSTVMALDRDAGEVDHSVVVVFDECRGHATNYNYINHHNKDFALAYDRQICLRDGAYLVNYGTIVAASNNQQHCYFKVNGVETGNIYNADSNNAQGSVSVALHLRRGDYLQIFGGHWSNNTSYSFYNIQRIDK